MKIHYNVPGKKRKEMALAISNWLGCEVEYQGAPTFAYRVGEFTIDKEGNLIADNDFIDESTVERLTQFLYDNGFESDLSHEEETTGISIQMPVNSVNIDNLQNIIDSKKELIKKALNAATLDVEVIENRVDFPWFAKDKSPEEIKAYMNFITALCKMSKEQQRVSAKEKHVENEKYAFRCFLLRLGFIGNEFKADRKILLKNLEGSSAFKNKEDN